MSRLTGFATIQTSSTRRLNYAIFATIAEQHERLGNQSGEALIPFVHLRAAGAILTSAQAETLQTGATRLMAAVMGKKAELTAVLIEPQDTARWTIRVLPVSLAAHLEVNVTAGTNSADEEAEFIRQAHGLLGNVLGPDLPLATYVATHEVSADAWGYGRLRQDIRRTGAA